MPRSKSLYARPVMRSFSAISSCVSPLRLRRVLTYFEKKFSEYFFIWIHVLGPPFRQISASSTKILFHHEACFHVVHFISSQKPGITVEAHLSAL